MAGDVIHVLESAYDLEGSDAMWLARAVEAVNPLLERGSGSTGFFFSVNARGVEIGSAHVLGAPSEDVLRRANAALRPDDVEKLYVDCPPCGTASQALGRSIARDPVGRRELAPHMADAIALRANTGPREGVVFTAPLIRPQHPTPRQTALYSRLASHIGAGLRLRRRLAREARRLDDADAILTPSGKVEHAGAAAQSKAARDALATAARSVDRARGRLRRADPDRAVELWRALVAGQWSLVDSFDHDGRRFVVAHQNQMLDRRHQLAALSDRERQVAMLAALGHGNKLIAYDLGLSLSSVSKYLRRAAAKLGASSRVALIRIMKSLPPK